MWTGAEMLVSPQLLVACAVTVCVPAGAFAHVKLQGACHALLAPFPIHTLPL